jgi:YVTN family beta-propeller protein
MVAESPYFGLTGTHRLVQVVMTPNGERTYRVNPDSDSVSVIDTQTGEVIATITVGPCPSAIVITPSGRQANVLNRGNMTISVIDISTNNVVTTVGDIDSSIRYVPTVSSEPYCGPYLNRNI